MKFEVSILVRCYSEYLKVMIHLIPFTFITHSRSCIDLRRYVPIFSMKLFRLLRLLFREIYPCFY